MVPYGIGEVGFTCNCWKTSPGKVKYASPGKVKYASPFGGRFSERLHPVNRHSPIHAAPVDARYKPPLGESRHGIHRSPLGRSDPSSNIRQCRANGSVLRVPPQNEPGSQLSPRQPRHRTIDERIQFPEAVRRCRRSLRLLIPLAGRCRLSRSRRFHRRQNRATRQNGRASVGSVVHRFAPHSSPALSSAAAVRPQRSAIAAWSLPRGSRFVVDVDSPPSSGAKN